MPNKTEHYQLNQYQPGDDFLRTDFNEDNAKIDVAIAGKCEMVYGSYVGNGSATRTIPLGFTPKAVLVCSRSGQMNTNYFNYGGLALEGLPCTSEASRNNGQSVVSIVDGGFTVYYVKLGTSYVVSSNNANTTFYYLALK